MSNPRFELRQITDTEWLVLDHRHDSHDSRQTIACICDHGTELEVLWMRDLPTLRGRYRTATDVLAAIQDYYNPPSRPTAPVAIPHLPPLTVRTLPSRGK